MTDKPNWAPEPWGWNEVEFAIVDKDGKVAALADYREFPETAHRIIACVNACAGIPILERMSMPSFKRQAINNGACKDISEEALLGVIRAGGFGKIIQGLMQQKFPDYKGHWEQQFINNYKEAPDDRRPLISEKML